MSQFFNQIFYACFIIHNNSIYVLVFFSDLQFCLDFEKCKKRVKCFILTERLLASNVLQSLEIYFLSAKMVEKH